MSTKDYILERIASGPLLKHFERDYSVFFISTWGKSHAEILNASKYTDGAITLVLGVYTKNVCQYYRLISDNEKVLNTVGDKMIANIEVRDEIFGNYALYGDQMLSFFEEIKQKPHIDRAYIERLAELCSNLVGYQILIIHRTDLYEQKFKNHPDILQTIYDLRKKYEPAFGLFETHFELLREYLLEERKNVTLEELKVLTHEEFATFVETNVLPENMPKRKELVVISHIPITEYFFGEDARVIEQAIRENERVFSFQASRSISIHGSTVYGNGRIHGACQVITDYDQMESLKEGSILVTPSTLPKYNHIYQRAKAIITDEGGVLAHVAILCRESKIPGIIGTTVATKKISRGSTVELNLDTGTIQVI